LIRGKEEKTDFNKTIYLLDQANEYLIFLHFLLDIPNDELPIYSYWTAKRDWNPQIFEGSPMMNARKFQNSRYSIQESQCGVPSIDIAFPFVNTTT